MINYWYGVLTTTSLFWLQVLYNSEKSCYTKMIATTPMVWLQPHISWDCNLYKNFVHRSVKQQWLQLMVCCDCNNTLGVIAKLKESSWYFLRGRAPTTVPRVGEATSSRSAAAAARGSELRSCWSREKMDIEGSKISISTEVIIFSNCNIRYKTITT
jgi:hypothetical protein